MRALLAVLTVSTGLVAPLAQGATGDLDPSFADHGRLDPIPRVGGHARSVELLESGGILVGGGDIDVSGSFYGDFSGRCTLRFAGSSFVRQLAEDGATDTTFNSAPVPDVEAVAMVRQADGRITVLGARSSSSPLIGAVTPSLRCFIASKATDRSTPPSA